ncbi:unnamed protein product [Merluccius merluccius]
METTEISGPGSASPSSVASPASASPASEPRQPRQPQSLAGLRASERNEVQMVGHGPVALDYLEMTYLEGLLCGGGGGAEDLLGCQADTEKS